MRALRKAVTALAAVAVAGVSQLGMLTPAYAAAGCEVPAQLSGPPPATYDHVIVIMDENFTYKSWLANTSTPYTHALAAECGSEGAMHAATHPSKLNYIAATSGLISSYSGANNIFKQTEARAAAGGQPENTAWRNYAESETTPCQATEDGFYKSGHVPAWFYNDLKTSANNTCVKYQIPMADDFNSRVANDTLPAYTWISPNKCDGMYYSTACPNTNQERRAVGDAWLSNLIPRLTAMSSYQTGHTLIVITWDEGDTTNPHNIDCTAPAVYAVASNNCGIPTIVVSPYITPGTIDHADHNLYGLLGTVEDVLGLPRLNRAVGQSSLRTGLGF